MGALLLPGKAYASLEGEDGSTSTGNPAPSEKTVDRAETLLRRFAEDETLLKDKRPVWILQRHIAPALVKGRKFHLRALLLCVGDLDAYVHRDVRALLATETFEAGRHDAANLRAHVTNMGVQKLLDDAGEYNEALQNLQLTDAASELYSKATAEDQADEIRRRICDILGETLRRVRAGGRRQLFTLPNCWELFGVDLLLEEAASWQDDRREGGTPEEAQAPLPEHRLVLLEVNASPSLAMYGAEAEDVRRQLLGPDPLEGLCNLEDWLHCFSSGSPAAD